MIVDSLNMLWRRKKRSLGKILQTGISDLAQTLRPVSEENDYSQQISGHEIQWINHDNKAEILFFYISDPRDLEIVSRLFQRTKNEQCVLSCIFVHQWTDGEGNWDVFGLHPQRGLVHWNRFWGNRWVSSDSGPALRDDIYNLFASDREFPPQSRKSWARMLEESIEKTKHQLSILAREHDCHQDDRNNAILWKNKRGRSEAMFSVYQNFPGIDDYIKIYDQIKLYKVPLTFLFQKAQPGIFDIFRFSTRSYIEHNNQAK